MFSFFHLLIFLLHHYIFNCCTFPGSWGKNTVGHDVYIYCYVCSSGSSCQHFFNLPLTARELHYNLLLQAQNFTQVLNIQWNNFSLHKSQMLNTQLLLEYAELKTFRSLASAPLNAWYFLFVSDQKKNFLSFISLTMIFLFSLFIPDFIFAQCLKHK